MSLQSKIHQFGKLVSDPRWLAFYSQRRVRNYRLRRRISDAIARFRGGQDQRLDQELVRTGQLHLGKLLSDDQCAELRAYFEARPVSDVYRPGTPSFFPLAGQRHINCHVAHHDEADVITAPYLMELANRPDILKLVEGFLGCKPTIGSIVTWWSYPTPIGAQQAEFFHRDVDDWRFVKLFIYLTDVGAQNGPHGYVLGSAQENSFSQIRRYTDTEVQSAFENRIVSMEGTAGDAFLEDTFGLHRGTPVRAGSRLVFQAIYGLFPGPYGPKQPLRTNPGHLDAYINRIYFRLP